MDTVSERLCPRDEFGLVIENAGCSRSERKDQTEELTAPVGEAILLCFMLVYSSLIAQETK